MKITKFVHACLLVEMPGPVNRTVLFDPGVFSEEVLDADKLEHLDDIIITHVHSDHVSVPLLKILLAKFPGPRLGVFLRCARSRVDSGQHRGSPPSAWCGCGAVPGG